MLGEADGGGPKEICGGGFYFREIVRDMMYLVLVALAA